MAAPRSGRGHPAAPSGWRARPHGVGTGIFVIIGEAIAQSGPALVISFLLAGITCIFSAYGYRHSRLRRGEDPQPSQ